jgi:hypothetical protein
MATFYLDYENGNDANNGTTWALAWKTITSGATAARIAAGDVIRIAKSPAPVSLGTTGVWTNLSKTVTLGAAQTATIDLCGVAWTAAAGGDTTVTLTAVATDAKQGSYCMKLAVDSAPQASILQAYYATGTLNLSAYQKISFWIKNSAAIADATTWVVKLCSDTAGATAVDTFYVPAIPSTARWVPLTLTKDGGGNLGSAIASIAIYTGATVPAASSNILVDDFIACTTDGLNLQSLISKNSAEQGGAEGWYGIQSINGTTVLLDTDTNTLANAGRGYSGTTETVTTYKRETIKTALASASATEVQTVQDSGTLGSNIEFQGGWNISTTVQEGETFFDGLNGNGYGIYLSSKSYITFNYLNVCRYKYGVYYDSSSNNNTITTLSNANNNSSSGVNYGSSSNNTITTLSNANNNTSYGVSYYSGNNNNTITTLSNANNNSSFGVYYYNSSNNTITTLSNANNSSYGVVYSSGYNNTIKFLSTSGNATSGIFNNAGINYLFNALIAEATEVAGYTSFVNSRIFSNKHDQTADNHWIFTDGGTINSQTAVRHTASGIAWRLNVTSADRSSSYPLSLSIAKIAVTANNLVTVKAWFRRSNTGITGRLICKGGQIAGVSNDVYTDMTAAADTWEELTITFTPTEAGVVEIEAQAWGGTTYSVYVDDMTITQA